MILSISISRDATNCEIASNIVKNATNVTNVKNVMNVKNVSNVMNVRNVKNVMDVRNVSNVKNVRNVMNAAGEEAGERVKKDERLGALALSLSARWRLPTLPLSQYHRRDKV